MFVGCQQLLQRLSPSLQRLLTQVLAAEKGHVEQIQQHVAGVADVEGILQRLEVRHAILVEYHQFAIQPGVLQFEAGQCLALCRQPVAPVVTVTGEQGDFAPGVETNHQPVAIELDFIQPVALGWLARVASWGDRVCGNAVLPLGFLRLLAPLSLGDFLPVAAPLPVGFAGAAAVRGVAGPLATRLPEASIRVSDSTLSGRSARTSYSPAGRASPSRSLISSHCSLSPLPRRRVRTSVQSPASFSPTRVNLSLPSR